MKRTNYHSQDKHKDKEEEEEKDSPKDKDPGYNPEGRPPVGSKDHRKEIRKKLKEQYAKRIADPEGRGKFRRRQMKKAYGEKPHFTPKGEKVRANFQQKREREQKLGGKLTDLRSKIKESDSDTKEKLLEKRETLREKKQKVSAPLQQIRKDRNKAAERAYIINRMKNRKAAKPKGKVRGFDEAKKEKEPEKIYYDKGNKQPAQKKQATADGLKRQVADYKGSRRDKLNSSGKKLYGKAELAVAKSQKQRSRKKKSNLYA